MQNRAYSILTVKAMDDEKRIISGTATTPTPDRAGDIVEPLGVKFENPLPFLWQHNREEPIGSVTFDKPTSDGIDFTAKVAATDEPGTLKDRLDEAWQSIKLGLVRAVSIGFRPLEFNVMEGGGYRFIESEVFELSAVTIPANSEALITSVKSIDAAFLADDIPAEKAPPASGQGRIVRLDTAGRARPLPTVHVKRTKIGA